VKNWRVLDSDSMNIDRITYLNWGAEGAARTAQSTY
jgi:hypothetical protein